MHRKRHPARALLRLERLEGRQLLSSDAAGLIDFSALRVDPTSYDPGHVLVRYKGDATAAGLTTVAVPAGMSLEGVLTSLRSDPNVAYAEPDYRITVEATPNDPRFPSQWALENTGQTNGTPDADIDAAAAWSVTTGAGGTVVAVIDTGINYNHTDLAANIWTNTDEIAGNGLDDDGNGYADDIHGYDFANNDADPLDDHGHGTHVAGTIGAVGNNGVGVAGVAWNNVKLMALKFISASGTGSVSAAIAALNYAVANGARISNNSWGSTEFSQALSDAITAAGTQGHIFVAAAGNNARSLDTFNFYPASFHLPNMVVVAASTSTDALAGFSNHSTTKVDLAAPGAGILSTLRGGGYGLMSGTSMAAPHVAGALAVVQGQHPNWTYRQVIDRILTTVQPTAAGARTRSGGRLDLAAAVGADEPPPPPVPTARYDFGTATSPLAAGYTRVTQSNSFTTALGYGWTSSGVQSRSRSIGTDLTRDFVMNETALLSFADNLASGTYDVTLTMGDASYAHDGQSIWLEGRQVDAVSLIRNQFIERTYTVVVNDGQLNLDLRGTNGNRTVLINGLVITPTTTAAASLQATPAAAEAPTAITTEAADAALSDAPAATPRWWAPTQPGAASDLISPPDAPNRKPLAARRPGLRSVGTVL
jgi:subtilisin family serine protease